jgi:exopolysaccharide biosynthesis predicted pyruvyltransferase EpsI
MHAELIRDFQLEICRVFDSLIPHGSRVALLDYPFHTNVGDSLIWLGEIKYLRQRGCEIVFVSSIDTHDQNLFERKLGSIDIILLHGGGNFGSVWPQFQVFREAIISKYVTKKIIQLPQSVHFDSSESASVSMAILAGHPEFYLIVRDQASYDLMNPRLSKDRVFLSPDSAFMLGDLTSSIKLKSASDVLLLSRTDSEKLSSGISSWIRESTKNSVIETDWLDEGKTEKWLLRIERRIRPLVKAGIIPMWFLQKTWELLCEARLSRGVDKLSMGNVVVTDRLHAHILSILLSKPQVVFDNNNNKLSLFFAKWTSRGEHIHFARGPDLSRSMLSSLEEALKGVK